MVTIATNKLKAALKCAAVDDDRCYLNAVRVFKDKLTGNIFIESTNGHYLFRGVLAEEGPDIDWVIPADKVKLAVTLKVREITITDTLLGDIVYQPIDAKFPDTDRVIPARLNGKPGVYDPYYLALCNDALRLWDGNKGAYYTLEQNGPSDPARMSTTDAFCIIMPRRV